MRKLILFPPLRYRDCTACVLHERCESVGIGMVTYGKLTHRRPAVVVIGQAPGWEEDERGAPWIGRSGKLLKTCYLDTGLTDLADVYLTNTVRCYPPGDAAPTQGQINACHPHTLTELQSLAPHYRKHGMYLLLCGAVACKGIFKGPLTAAFKRQGHPYMLPTDTGEVPLPTYATYHPAAILRKKGKGNLALVEDHLNLLLAAIQGDIPEYERTPYQMAPTRLPTDIRNPVSLDIETYGILGGHEQRHFQPDLCRHHDGATDPIVTISLTLLKPKPEGTAWTTRHTYAYLWHRMEHRRRFLGVLRYILDVFRRRHERPVFLASNIGFDIGMLRAESPALHRLLSPRNCDLLDLAVVNYLDHEARPERAQKPLAQLLGVATRPPHEFRQYPSADDPDLLEYNAHDTFEALDVLAELRRRTRRTYGATSNKYSPRCLRWYSDLLWNIHHMTAAGVYFHHGKLRRLRTACMQTIERLNKKALAQYDGPFQGKGSQKLANTMVIQAFDSIPVATRARYDWERTKVAGRLSTKQTNLTLIRLCLGPDSPYTAYVTDLEEYRRNLKIATTHVDAILQFGVPRPRYGLLSAHPTIYPVPSEDEAGEKGGTKQSRLSIRKPPLQTEPPPVMACMASRFGPQQGSVMGWDLSQIELVVASVASGDPRMLEETRSGIDRHAKRAHMVFSQHDEYIAARNISDAPKLSQFRQAGKRLNFLVLFWGGPDKFQWSCLHDAGLHVPLYLCENAILQDRKYYHHRYRWQYQLVILAKKQGYIELPLLGQSRRFGNADEEAPDIVNFPVQTQAANVMHAVQTAIREALDNRGVRSKMVLQIHDEVILDVHHCEERAVASLVHRAITKNAYWTALCRHYGVGTIPLRYERKTYTGISQ